MELYLIYCAVVTAIVLWVLPGLPLKSQPLDEFKGKDRYQ